jgi:predicted enzyme related to lactoylglutathione lyase
MGTTEFGLGKIGQIAVNAHDLERAIAFYRDVLGVKFLFQVPKMAFFQAGSVRLLIGIPETPEFDHPASILYYDVEDINGAHDVLTSRGVVFREKPQKVADLGDRVLWLAFFNDSESNVVALMSEVPKTA